MGAVDFTMTQLHNEAWLQKCTPEQLAYLNSIPGWAVIGWGAGTWGGLLGSLLILLRRGFAVNLFAVSLIGVVLTDVYTYGLSDGYKVMGGNPGVAIFSAVIAVIAVLLFVYSRTQRTHGVLRG